MTEEARGQVGGIESTDEVRRRLAGESGKFRCQGCGGKSNAEILGEQEELARKLEEEEGSMREEEKVPEDLKLGYREDIEGKKETKELEGKGVVDEAAGIAAIAGAGSAPAAGENAALQENVSEPPQLPPAPQPHHATVATASAPPPLRPQRQQTTAVHAAVPTTQMQRQAQPEATASSWIDLAIIGIAVMLGVMILKNVLKYLDG